LRVLQRQVDPKAHQIPLVGRVQELDRAQGAIASIATGRERVTSSRSHSSSSARRNEQKVLVLKARIVLDLSGRHRWRARKPNSHVGYPLSVS
jgi:hypothetical protein